MKKQQSQMSQQHGLIFENEIRNKVFNTSVVRSNTFMHDISRCNNIFNPNENVSIKSTGSYVISCGDVLRFHDYDFSLINTLITLKWVQEGDLKRIERIYEIDYNQDCHAFLFGCCPRNVIQDYVSYIKSIPKGVVSDTKRKEYVSLAKEIRERYNCYIRFNPKVDSKEQRRVQCSIPKFNTLEPFIRFQSPTGSPNLVRGVLINPWIESARRKKW